MPLAAAVAQLKAEADARTIRQVAPPAAAPADEGTERHAY
jgi:threonyl-tRNA synthetase